MIRILNLMQLGSIDGCTWYRVKQLEKELNRQGLANMQYLDFSLEDKVFNQVLSLADIFYARLNPQLSYVIDNLRTFSKAPLIIDIDDSIDDINPLSDHYRHLGVAEVELSDGTKLWEDGKNIDLAINKETVEKYKEALRKADAVTVTTFELKQYAEQFNDCVVIIPNAVNLELFPKVKSINKKGINLVWSGGSSHFEDLIQVAPVIEKVMLNYPQVHFHILGVPFEGVIKNLPKDRVHKYSWVSADAHGYRLSCIDADIAIAPLVDAPFNRLKSSIKMYEMGALSVPTVAKDIPPYSDDIIHEKTGMLYNTNDEMYDAIVKLIEDPILRTSIGNGAFEYVKNNRQLKDSTQDFYEFVKGIHNVYKNNL